MNFHWEHKWHHTCEAWLIGIPLLLLVCAFVFRRRKLALVAAVSLVLFALFAATYAMSYQGEGVAHAQLLFSSGRGGCATKFYYTGGGFGFYASRSILGEDEPAISVDQRFMCEFRKGPSFYPFTGIFHHLRVWGQLYGFQLATGQTLYSDTQQRYQIREIHITTPGWAMLMLLSIFPSAWIIRRIRHKTLTPGCCQKCGYDLRAHQTGDKCPECATSVPPKPIETSIIAQNPVQHTPLE